VKALQERVGGELAFLFFKRCRESVLRDFGGAGGSGVLGGGAMDKAGSGRQEGKGERGSHLESDISGDHIGPKPPRQPLLARASRRLIG
jgi:hypothetical protein